MEKHFVTVELPADVHQELKDIAKATGKLFRGVVLEAVRAYIKKEKAKMKERVRRRLAGI